MKRSAIIQGFFCDPDRPCSLLVTWHRKVGEAEKKPNAINQAAEKNKAL